MPFDLKPEHEPGRFRIWTWFGLEPGRDVVLKLDAILSQIWMRFGLKPGRDLVSALYQIRSLSCSVLRHRPNSVSDPDPIWSRTWKRFGLEPGCDSVLNLDAIWSQTWTRFGFEPRCNLGLSNLDAISVSNMDPSGLKTWCDSVSNLYVIWSRPLTRYGLWPAVSQGGGIIFKKNYKWGRNSNTDRGKNMIYLLKYSNCIRLYNILAISQPK